MPIEIKINNSLNPNARYITYSPSPCQIRQTPAGSALTVKLKSKAANAGGGVAVFYANRAVGAQPTATLTVTLPANGTWVDFGLAGKQGKPSVDDLDCLLIATGGGATSDGSVDGACPQERQQAQTPRARPVSSCAGKAQQRHPGAQHVPSAAEHACGRRRLARSTADLISCPGTERICLTSNVGYRRSIRQCPCTIGVSTSRHPRYLPSSSWAKRSGCLPSADFVLLDPGNPLVGWVTDSDPGILRASLFNTKTEAAPGLPGFELLNQAQTLALGPNYPAIPWDGRHAPWGRARLVQRVDI